MAQFRSTQDLIDLVLRNSGELTDGNSPFEQQALDHLNKVHHAIIAGGNEFEVEVDEPWSWAKAKNPIIVELLPKFDTGTITLTKGDDAGTFSSAPAISLEGYFVRVSSRSDIYRIAEHTAGQTAFQLDYKYIQDSGALIYKAFKLEYELDNEYMIVDDSNNKIDFEETAATELTATLTNGSYTPADLATEVKTQMEAVGASVYTPTYNSKLRKFTVLSDGAGGGNILSILFASGTNAECSSASVLGYDILDLTAALTYTSVYVKDGVVRLVQPARSYSENVLDERGSIYGIPELTMHKRFPLTEVVEGVPRQFAVTEETSEGKIKVMFDRYPKEEMRIEFEHIPIPRDLQNNAISVPILPRKWVHILIYGATYYTLFDKEDSKAQTFFGLTQAKLRGMVKAMRRDLQRVGQNFGSVVPRPDNERRIRRRFIFGGPDN